MSEKKSVKSRVQNFGSFLSSMVMPNIAALIAWGFMAALFIPTGWLPNENFNKIVGPLLKYAIPMLIAYTGGNLVNPKMGGVVGVVALLGAIAAAENEVMLVAAMLLGPLAGWLLKKLQDAYDGHVPQGFEMLVNNFSAGFLALGLSLISYVLVAPLISGLTGILAAGINFLLEKSLLPLVHIFIEPAKILFLNNAINHGIFTPIGLDQAATSGKSILFMIESNPGPGLGVLLAYTFFGKKEERSSAVGAAIIQVFGGIHEIFFPYVLMNPKLILATILGGASGTFTLEILKGGLVASPSPGSILAWLAMTPKGSYLATILGFVVATLVSLLVASFILKTSKSSKTFDQASKDLSDSKNSSKSLLENETKSFSNISKIRFACDAGMGSSAMGASILKKKLKQAGLLEGIDITNVAIANLPKDVDLVVTHKDLTERAKQIVPNAIHVSVDNFMQAPEYDEVVERLKESENPQLSNENSKKEEVEEIKEEKADILTKENIVLDQNFQNKEEAIAKVQELMEKSGFVGKGYQDGMLQREKEAPTHFGIGLAIPHGTNQTKKEIKKSGLVVITSKKGVNWDGELVKLIIGIAGKGDDHLQILANVANNVNTEEIVNELVENGNKDQIYEILTREEE